MLDVVFGNSGRLFWRMFVHPGTSGPHKSMPDGLTDLRARNESSGACLGLIFWTCSLEVRTILEICNFNFKKSPLQELSFLSKRFLSGS